MLIFLPIANVDLATELLKVMAFRKLHVSVSVECLWRRIGAFIAELASELQKPHDGWI
jgi:hypothetical protein